MTRLFAAVTLPPDVQTALDQVVAALADVRGLRWTDRPNRHVTLRFFGDGDPEAVASELRRIEFSPFDLSLQGLGQFPPRGPISVAWVGVAWVGVAGAVDPLKALAADVEGTAVGLGFATECRPFVPHVTIGRAARSHRGPARIPDIVVPPVAFRVADFTLYASELGPGGPTYRVVARF